MSTSADILARMTPSLVANVLEDIACQIRDAQPPELVKPLDEIDVLHLRQIADWLEKRIADGKAIDQDEQVQAFLAGLRKEAQK